MFNFVHDILLYMTQVRYQALNIFAYSEAFILFTLSDMPHWTFCANLYDIVMDRADN